MRLKPTMPAGIHSRTISSRLHPHALSKNEPHKESGFETVPVHPLAAEMSVTRAGVLAAATDVVAAGSATCREDGAK